MDPVVVDLAFPWIPFLMGLSALFGGVGVGSSIINQRKMRKEQKAASKRMASALKKPSAASPAMGTNVGAVGKVGREAGRKRTLMGGYGTGSTGPGKGLLS